MSDRKTEIEYKKAKLLALREEKKKREESKKVVINDSDTNAWQATEDLLKNLGISESAQISDHVGIESDVVTKHLEFVLLLRLNFSL